jgi:putative tricarboxylic transport membrane protein
LTTDRAAGAVLALIGLFVLWESLLSARHLPVGSLRSPGPAYVPVVLAVLLIALGVALNVVRGDAKHVRTHAVAITAVSVFAALMLERLGYRITMAVVLLVLLAIIERRGPVVSVAVAGGLAFGSFYLFDTLLRVPLPRGPFGL